MSRVEELEAALALAQTSARLALEERDAAHEAIAQGVAARKRLLDSLDEAMAERAKLEAELKQLRRRLGGERKRRDGRKARRGWAR